jgi:uncharacterized cupredoxin-like copper-binding protein
VTPPEAKPAPPERSVTPFAHAVDLPVGVYVLEMGRHGRCERRHTGWWCRRIGGASVVEAEVQLNRIRVRRTGVMTAVASFALLALTACGGEEAHEDVTRVPTMSDAAAQATRDAASAPAATPGAEGGTPVVGASPATGTETTTAATTIDVVSFDIYFEPSEVTIPANTDVTVNLPNQGVTPHNFSIDELEIDVDIAPGATEQVVINAPAGEYEYYCNVPGHKQAGMVGTLIVSDDAAAAPAGVPTTGAEASPAASTEETPAGSPVAPAAASPAAAGAAAPQTVEVLAYDIYFEPQEVTTPADTDVTVAIANDGVAPHNFSIDELGIDIDIPAGETQETVINAPAGEYEFYCNVPGHKEAGMVGTLIVSEDAAAAPGDTAAAGATPAEATVEQAAPATSDGATPATGEDEQAAAGAGTGEAVAVESYDIYFEPSELTSPADTDVTVRLPNEGVTPHNFSIDELGISVDIAPGATEEAVINAPAGTYEYYCNVPGHKQAGMVGTLTVG